MPVPGCGAAAGRRRQRRQPLLLALTVQGVHPGRFQRRGGVLQRCQLVYQRAALCFGIGHGLALGRGGTVGVSLAGFRRRGGLVGGAVGVRRGFRQRLCGGGCGFRGLERPRASGRHSFQGRGIFERLTGAADEAAEGRIQAAVAVEVAGQLAELLAGLGLFRLGGGSPGGRDGRCLTAGGQLHEGLAVRVVRLQRRGEAGFLGGRGIGQEPVDPGDLCRRRAFTGLGSGDLLRRGDLRRRRNPAGSRQLPGRRSQCRSQHRWKRCGLCRERERSKEDDGGAEHSRLATGSGPAHGQTSLKSQAGMSEVGFWRVKKPLCGSPSRHEATCQRPLWQHESHQ